MTYINKTEEIMKKLREEGKVHVMNTSEDYRMMEAMNEHMEKVHEDYLIKDYNSKRGAAKIILRQNLTRILVQVN